MSLQLHSHNRGQARTIWEALSKYTHPEPDPLIFQFTSSWVRPGHMVLKKSPDNSDMPL